MAELPNVTVQELLDAGVHFGHKPFRWNPKMAPYIYGEKDGIHVIDLGKTAQLMRIAIKRIYDVVKDNGRILIVGSKIQASDIVAEYATKCGQFYVNHRWLGGLLTNWSTISKSIRLLTDVEKTLSNEEELAGYTKKEILDMNRKKGKLTRAFGGIRKMGGLPSLVVVIDTNREHLAISEARKLGIPIIAIVDTNCNPDVIDLPIPGNDDAIRSIKLYCSLFADAALAGITDSLAASGVDVGANADAQGKDRGTGNVKKLKTTDRVSKAATLLDKKEIGGKAKSSALNADKPNNNQEE